MDPNLGDNNLNSSLSRGLKSPAIAAIIIVAVAALAVAAGLFWARPGTKNPGTESRSAANPPSITPESTRRALLGDSLLVFPVIASRTEIPVSGLPKELTVFIRKGVSDLKAEKTLYADKTGGFYVQYNVPNIPFVDSFNGFISVSRKNGWGVLTASRANLFAFLDLENSIYRLRVSQTLKNGTDGEITLEVLKK